MARVGRQKTGAGLCWLRQRPRFVYTARRHVRRPDWAVLDDGLATCGCRRTAGSGGSRRSSRAARRGCALRSIDRPTASPKLHARPRLQPAAHATRWHGGPRDAGGGSDQSQVVGVIARRTCNPGLPAGRTDRCVAYRWPASARRRGAVARPQQQPSRRSRIPRLCCAPALLRFATGSMLLNRSWIDAGPQRVRSTPTRSPATTASSSRPASTGACGKARRLTIRCARVLSDRLVLHGSESFRSRWRSSRWSSAFACDSFGVRAR